jgi:hypothetical protein
MQLVKAGSASFLLLLLPSKCSARHPDLFTKHWAYG